jgi:subtilisin
MWYNESTIMNTKKIAYLLVFSMLLGMGNFVYAAADDDSRYFVSSTKGFWKNSFGARNNFDNGFTADLSPWELRLAGIFGVEVTKVKKFHVLPSKGKKPPKGGSARVLPSDQTPWGIEAVYDDFLINETSGGLGIGVGVLDTGVNIDHVDLKNRVIDCKDFTNRRNPVIDGKCDDKNGHGTHVAGVIAADAGDDSMGVYGIAPESNIFAYKVCGNNGSCWADDIANGITTATDNGVNIINLSLGGDSPSTLISDAIVYAAANGVLIVGASGNDGPYSGSIDYPAANKEVLAVGAINRFFEVTDWSSRGINSSTNSYVVEEGDIEFAAPGVGIESTWNDNGYAVLSGTSMATPHVSGLAAKLWQASADDPATATRGLLHQFSVDLDAVGDDDASGWGMPRL